jgi:hypothetical protein
MSIPSKILFVISLKSMAYKSIHREHADKFNTIMPTNLILESTPYADKTNTHADT